MIILPLVKAQEILSTFPSAVPGPFLSDPFLFLLCRYLSRIFVKIALETTEFSGYIFLIIYQSLFNTIICPPNGSCSQFE
jgi:hypothetical protein